MSLPEQERSSFPISIERCTTLEDLRECVRLQRTIWNDPDEDLVPSAMLVVANKIGGHVLMARDGSRAVGLALAFPAFRGDLRYLHSHIVGVIPEYQNRGLGRQIKLKQRELAMEMHVPLIEWSFDPLAIRNAHFNISRLGAIARRFYPNLYGVTASPLHGGLPTDRLVAEWWLSSPRVDGALAGEPPISSPEAVQIAVPLGIEEAINSGSTQAAEIQAGVKAQFQERFAQGFAVTGFRIEEGKGVYLLEPRETRTGQTL